MTTTSIFFKILLWVQSSAFNVTDVIRIFGHPCFYLKDEHIYSMIMWPHNRKSNGVTTSTLPSRRFFFTLVFVNGPPLWSSGQNCWLQIQRSEFDSRRYQIFWEVVGLERGALSLVSTIEELLERKSSCSGLESREYGRRDPSHWPRGTLYQQKFTLTSPTNGGRSVDRYSSFVGLGHRI
jgi:hypothetical protein